MAVESTSSYPAPFLAPFGELLADYTVSELNRPVDIAGIMPRVAAVDPFTQAAQGRAAQQAGLGAIQYDSEGRIIGFGQGTGIAAYEPFLQQAAAQVQAGPSGYQQYMSPYQQDVINEAVKRQEEYGAQQQQNLAASAVDKVLLVVVVMMLQEDNYKEEQQKQLVKQLQIYKLKIMHKQLEDSNKELQTYLLYQALNKDLNKVYNKD
jgi:hypothetical protein